MSFEKSQYIIGSELSWPLAGGNCPAETEPCQFIFAITHLSHITYYLPTHLSDIWVLPHLYKTEFNIQTGMLLTVTRSTIYNYPTEQTGTFSGKPRPMIFLCQNLIL